MVQMPEALTHAFLKRNFLLHSRHFESLLHVTESSVLKWLTDPPPVISLILSDYCQPPQYLVIIGLEFHKNGRNKELL